MRQDLRFTMAALAILLFARQNIAFGKSIPAQKLDFDEVVVQTLDRAPSKLDTVGIIDRKGKGKALYQKKSDFREENFQTLREVETAW